MDMSKKLLTALACCAGVCGKSCAADCAYNVAGTCEPDKTITVKLPEAFFNDLQLYFMADGDPTTLEALRKLLETKAGETVCLNWSECVALLTRIDKGASQCGT